MNNDLLKIEGFDKAIIGACMTWHGDMLVERVIYDGPTIASMLMGNGGMTEEEAQDHIDFNIIGAYVGEASPIVMWPATAEDIDAGT